MISEHRAIDIAEPKLLDLLVLGVGGLIIVVWSTACALYSLLMALVLIIASAASILMWFHILPIKMQVVAAMIGFFAGITLGFLVGILQVWIAYGIMDRKRFRTILAILEALLLVGITMIHPKETWGLSVTLLVVTAILILGQINSKKLEGVLE